jgi:hypothetical protein
VTYEPVGRELQRRERSVRLCRSAQLIEGRKPPRDLVRDDRGADREA